MKEAMALYTKASAVKPENSQLHYNMAVLYWKLEKWGKVIEEFGKVLELDPGNKNALRYINIAKEKVKK
jgi:tetratricopeptide (TPR) repeat protein